MNQKEILERALQAIKPVDEDDPLDVAMNQVLVATYNIKKWEADEGDPSECECEQCVAAVALAEVIIKIAEGEMS